MMKKRHLVVSSGENGHWIVPTRGKSVHSLVVYKVWN